jgi:hypothetical protein
VLDRLLQLGLLELALEELGAIVDVKQEADTESVLGTTEERVVVEAEEVLQLLEEAIVEEGVAEDDPVIVS